MAQKKQTQWLEQWQLFQDDELFLFQDWISPNSLEDFRDKDVLEAGCGGGQHSGFMAPYARKVIAVDLNATRVARDRNRAYRNIHFLEADISDMKFSDGFDIVLSVGVIHHTDNPDDAVRNLISLLRPNGRLIIWVYSKEGNWFVESVVEPLRKRLLSNSSPRSLLVLSQILTILMCAAAYSIYILPFRWLPYYEYLKNARRLSFKRNTLNVYDKLNAPQVEFISRERAESWLKLANFADVNIDDYLGVSWRISGTLVD